MLKYHRHQPQLPPAPVDLPSVGMHLHMDDSGYSSSYGKPTVPEALPALPLDQFHRLRTEFKARFRNMKTLKDTLEWIEYAKRQLGGSKALLDQFFDWDAEYDRAQKPEPADVSLPELKSSLLQANWKEPHTGLTALYTALSRSHYSPRGIKAMNWTCEEFELGLQVGGAPLAPVVEVDAQLCEAYGVDVVGFKRILGMRYVSADNPHEKRSLLIATLGRICYREIGTEDWFRCGFVLAVEIQEDDGKAGDLLIIIQSFENEDEDEVERWPPLSCHGLPIRRFLSSFTVARLYGDSYGVLDAPGSPVAYKIKVESKSAPEIVQVGYKIVGPGRPQPLPVGLFPIPSTPETA